MVPVSTGGLGNYEKSPLAVPNFENDLACHEELVRHLAYIGSFQMKSNDWPS
jgi:hypothetical protein